LNQKNTQNAKPKQMHKIKPEPKTKPKPKPTVNFKNCSYVCTYRCAQLS